MARVPVILALFCLAPAASALTLDVPGNPRLAREEIEPAGSYAVPVAPWQDGDLPVRITEGQVTRQVWRISGAGIATLRIVQPLRDQLREQGFTILLDCDTAVCGGFDFRFATEVMAPPAMYVDLSSFRFLSAERLTVDSHERVGILISRTATEGFVQIIRVGPLSAQATIAAAPTPIDPATPVAPRAMPSDLRFTLESDGHAILSDLTFESGSAQLAPGEFASLRALADYLLANAGARVALVGHTDAEGSLAANIALSQRRAASVMERLASLYAIPRQQMTAEGMGWLAPVASNLTDAGREANRRVEVVLLPPA